MSPASQKFRSAKTDPVRLKWGFGKGFLKDKFAFSRLLKILYLRGETCLQNARSYKQKRPCLKRPLIWTGSVFPHLLLRNQRPILLQCWCWEESLRGCQTPAQNSMKILHPWVQEFCAPLELGAKGSGHFQTPTLYWIKFSLQKKSHKLF